MERRFLFVPMRTLKQHTTSSLLPDMTMIENFEQNLTGDIVRQIGNQFVRRVLQQIGPIDLEHIADFNLKVVLTASQ